MKHNMLFCPPTFVRALDNMLVRAFPDTEILGTHSVRTDTGVSCITKCRYPYPNSAGEYEVTALAYDSAVSRQHLIYLTIQEFLDNEEKLIFGIPKINLELSKNTKNTVNGVIIGMAVYNDREGNRSIQRGCLLVLAKNQEGDFVICIVDTDNDFTPKESILPIHIHPIAFDKEKPVMKGPYDAMPSVTSYGAYRFDDVLFKADLMISNIAGNF